MQLATPIRLTPSPRASADHASFDVLAMTGVDGRERRLGLVGGTRFWTARVGASAFEDAAVAAQAVAATQGQAFAILAAHPGMLFVAPVFERAADGSSTPVAAALDALAGVTLVGRHGRVLGIVGADRTVDLRTLAPSLGSGRG
jgi:hypothetical protein